MFSILRSQSNSTEGSKSKKKKKSKKPTGDDDAVLNLANLIQPLSYQSLDKGMVLLGCVSSVADYELKVSLPGHLVATVPITNISKPYSQLLRKIASGEEEEGVLARPLSEMFRVGQTVVCAVDQASANDDGFYKVIATLDPRMVQGSLPVGEVKKGATVQAAVVSVEDHGYVVDLGVIGIRAFLPSKKVEKYSKRVLGGEQPGVGEVLPVTVTKCESGLATVSCEPGKLLKSEVDPAELSVHTMVPGTSVQVQVKKAVSGGVKVTFGDFTGFITRDHMMQEMEEEQNCEAKILYVAPTTNTIYLSCKSHLKFGQQPSLAHLEKVGPGHLANTAEVVHSSRQGLVVRLVEDEETDAHIPLGYVSARQVTDGEVPDLKQKYPAGTKVACRVISYDYADAMYICSMQKSTLAQKNLQTGTLVPGEKVSGKVKKFVNGGLLVEIAKNREAFIPMLHLSDVSLKNPEKKFPPGKKINCRVLRVDNDRRRLHLTHKTILVNEDYPVVSEYDPAQVGVQTEGVVVKIASEGLLLQLFGEVRGWVPKSKMSPDPIEYPEKLFFIGQVLKCQVVNVNPAAKRLTLSLILGGHHKPLGSKQKKEGDGVKLGHFYDCVVKDKSDNGLSVEIDNDGQATKAFLPSSHLTDYPDMAKFLLASYNVDDVIKDVLCFERDVVPIMTAKPMIKEVARNDSLPKSLKDLTDGLILPCVVCSVKPYGVFLRLPTWKFRKSALVPIRLLSNQHVEDINEYVSVHQTVMAKVVERNEEEEKITMSMRPKDFEAGTAEDAVKLLVPYLEDEERAKSVSGPLSLFKCGSLVSATVVQVTSLGLETVSQGVRGIVTNAGLEGLSGKRSVGEVLSCVVLYADLDFGCVELTANPDIVRVAAKHSSKRRPKPDQVVKANVVLVKSEFHFATVCVRSGPHAGTFVHVPTRRHINDFVGDSDSYVVGDQHTVVVKEVTDSGTIVGVLERQERKSGKKRRKDSESKEPAKDKDTSDEKKTQESPSKNKRQRTDSERSAVESVSGEVKEVNPTADPGWAEDFDPWNETKVKEEVVETTTEKKPLKTHLSKKEKKQLDKLEAEEVARAEQRVLDGEEAEPETAEEFDRLVLAMPNSSLCWIKYMALHMQKKDTEKARQVVKRALEKINVREEAERLNVYMAWLNLEQSLGDEESTENVMTEALKYNDPYKVYSRAAASFEQNGDGERAEKLYKTLARRFCKEIEPWVLLGTHYFAKKDLKEARFTLQRSIQNLDRKHHVSITVKFGLLEFRMGEVERGKTVFETVLGNFPGRTDLWSVYADALVKADEIEAARSVFERMIALRLQPKKMKFFFKKYLTFEEEHGGQQGVDKVRKKALEYVEGTVGLQDIKQEIEDD